MRARPWQRLFLETRASRMIPLTTTMSAAEPKEASPKVLQKKNLSQKRFAFRLQVLGQLSITLSSPSPSPSRWCSVDGCWVGAQQLLALGAYCLQLLSDSWLGVRTSPREVVPSKRCEAMAAWWDMLFRTMSPFRHNTTSCCLK